MEPTLLRLFAEAGLPSWLLPDSLSLTGMAGFASALWILAHARRQRLSVAAESRALFAAFCGAFVGATVFDWPFSLPLVLEQRTLDPLMQVDQNVFGAIIGGAVAGSAYRFFSGDDVAGFLDRSVRLWGVMVVCTRLGCFLNGCDFGVPTVHGVRFPAGSPAAVSHASLGFVPDRSASLPVHPVALYEVALAGMATVVALLISKRKVRPGSAFLGWLLAYCGGRVLIDGLRADSVPFLGALSRVHFCSVALAVVTLLGAGLFLRLRPRGLATASLVAGMFVATSARAQEPSPTPLSPPEVPAQQAQVDTKASEGEGFHRFGGRLGVGAALAVTGAVRAGGGLLVEGSGLYRIRISQSVRFQFGLTVNRFADLEAAQWGFGLPLEAVSTKVLPGLDLVMGGVLGYTLVDFQSRHFEDFGAPTFRVRLGLQRRFGEFVTVGLNPVAFVVMFSDRVDTFIRYEPHVYVAY